MPMPRFSAGNRWPQPKFSPSIARSWCDCTSHLELNHFHVGWIDLPQKHHHLSGHPGGQRLEGLGMVGIRKKIVDHVILVKDGIKRGEPTGFWTLRHYGTFWCRFLLDVFFVWFCWTWKLCHFTRCHPWLQRGTVIQNGSAWSGRSSSSPCSHLWWKWTNDMDKLEFSWYKSDF